jgi:hypothetical protein
MSDLSIAFSIGTAVGVIAGYLIYWMLKGDDNGG